MIPLKSDKDIEKIRKSGRITAKVIRELLKIVEPGISTKDIDNIAAELIHKENATSAFKGYKGFPGYICTSVNEEIVHGIPGEKRLKPGDILSLDVGINYEGYFSDAAVTATVGGEVLLPVQKLIDVTRDALAEGIKQARENNHLSDISYAIQSYVEKSGFSVVREFVGHGVGYSLHEDPEIPNFGIPKQGPLLAKGMVFAIEPMVNMGTWETQILDNGWTAVTKDRSLSAHFEHTIAITRRGPEILTN